MARTTRYTSVIEDVNRSFERFVKDAPKIARRYCSTAVFLTTAAVYRRMENGVPVDDGDLRNELHFDHKGLRGRAGILKSEGENDMAHRALYNEYLPNKQPFMRPAAQAEQGPFVKRMQEAIAQCARDLERGL